MAERFFRSSAILKRILSLKTQNFAVKLNCKNRFTLVTKSRLFLLIYELQIAVGQIILSGTKYSLIT